MECKNRRGLHPNLIDLLGNEFPRTPTSDLAEIIDANESELDQAIEQAAEAYDIVVRLVADKVQERKGC